MVQHRFVHLLVVAPPKHEGILHPNASRGIMESCVYASAEEIHLLRI